MYLLEDKIRSLESTANKIRQLIIESLVVAGSGHTAGSLGMVEVFTLLYFHVLRHRPDEPDWPDRDRLILSNGHICPVLYAVLAEAGYFSVEELKTLRLFGSRLQGHPHREFLPGLETSSGPLGSGLSQAVGMAMACRSDDGPSDRFFYCLMSDGELESGNIWEAAMLAGKEGLHNLIGIIDRNNIQIDGFTEEVMPLEPLASKWRAWNWQVLEVSGHNFKDLNDAIEQAKAVFNRPTVIIAHTVPGKGVKEFEWRHDWHGKTPDKQLGMKAIKEIRTLGGRLKED